MVKKKRSQMSKGEKQLDDAMREIFGYLNQSMADEEKKKK